MIADDRPGRSTYATRSDKAARQLSHPNGTSIRRGPAFSATKISFAVLVQFLLGAPRKLHKIQRPG